MSIRLLYLYNKGWLGWSEEARSSFAWTLGYFVYAARVVQKLGTDWTKYFTKSPK